MVESTRKTKYALIGTGGRAMFFYVSLVRDFKSTAELVAFCDVNQTRMDFANRKVREYGVGPLPTFKAAQFDRMIEQTKPDTVIVTTVDRTHHRYIIRAMELGCDVISEKPMTIDKTKCQDILDAVKRTGKNLRVTFNYRYAPHNTKVRELIADGTIGKVTAVHFEWLLNTKHGADYFRRWHRDKRNSGGLLVHKSTHHFDLVNFWLHTKPKTVYASGGLKFYGKENAEERGVTEFYSRCHGSSTAMNDPFGLDLNESNNLKELYLDAEHEDQYYRDQSVFGEGISIEDTLAVLVNYENGAVMSYSLSAYSPWEGFKVNFSGTAGRIELEVVEKSYVNSGGAQDEEGAASEIQLKVFPMFDAPYVVPIVEEEGGHGGGDPKLLNDVFGVPEYDRFHRAASHVDGAMSILTGIAGNISLNTGLPVEIQNLVDFS
jgi:predicted dehydrogenase